MTQMTKLLVDAHIRDLREEADRAAFRAVAARGQRRTSSATDFPVTIRRAAEADEPALVRLAALDSARVPAGPVLLGESDGQLRAALSLTDGTAVADPFHPTAAIVELLVKSAAQAKAGRDAPARLQRLRRFRQLPARRRQAEAEAALTQGC